MKQFRFLLGVIVGLLILIRAGSANNVQVANITLTGQDATNDFTYVQFDLSWENSWRTTSAPGNWDAVWVFVKYKAQDGLWKTAYLSTTASDHSVSVDNGVPATISVGTTTINGVSRGVGVFIYRSSDGSGSINWQDVRLKWLYGVNGLGDDAAVEVKVFAIEMVYIPQGTFAVGDPSGASGPTNCFYTYGTGGAYTISSEAAINVGATNGYLYYDQDNTDAGDQGGPIPAEFPKGYQAFYIMKYELSQEQYVAFLNTLTRDQQNNRTATDISGTSITNVYVMSNSSTMLYRNAIRCDATLPSVGPVNFYLDYNGNSTGNEGPDGQNIACNYLNWGDITAYADWAGLRPMTELEFEKAARGILPAVSGEYVWGDTSLANAAYTLSNEGEPLEWISANYGTNVGNAAYSTTYNSGPLRCGIFADNTNNNGRVTAGASYYGVMELSGNLEERVVHVGSTTSRAFQGTHGDGELDANGNATNADWAPGSGADIEGVRGGDYSNAKERMRLADRSAATETFGNPRQRWKGFRAVRTAP